MKLPCCVSISRELDSYMTERLHTVLNVSRFCNCEYHHNHYHYYQRRHHQHCHQYLYHEHHHYQFIPPPHDNHDNYFCYLCYHCYYCYYYLILLILLLICCCCNVILFVFIYLFWCDMRHNRQNTHLHTFCLTLIQIQDKLNLKKIIP